MQTSDAETVHGVLRGTVQECERLAGVLRSASDRKVADETVHELRKLLKEARSLQRLFRGQMSREEFRAADRHLRDAGRILSDYRRMAALRECLQRLVDDGDLTADLAALWSERLNAVPSDLFEQRGELAAAVLGELGRFRPPHQTTEAQLWATLALDRRRMQKRARTCERSSGDTELHEFRKGVKTYRAQLKQLAPSSEELPTLTALGSRLGDLHDLADLEAYLSKYSQDEQSSLHALREAMTQARARLLGEVWMLYETIRHGRPPSVPHKPLRLD